MEKIPGRTAGGLKRGKKYTHEIIWLFLDCWSGAEIKNIGGQ